MYIPDKGDVIWLDFEPGAGQEITKRRPAFVVSRRIFNEHTGFAIVAPITSNPRGTKLEVDLDSERVDGVVLMHQIRSLDFAARNAELIETAKDETTSMVSELAQVILR